MKYKHSFLLKFFSLFYRKCYMVSIQTIVGNSIRLDSTGSSVERVGRVSRSGQKLGSDLNKLLKSDSVFQLDLKSVSATQAQT